jgi:hypothetical protein
VSHRDTEVGSRLGAVAVGMVVVLVSGIAAAQGLAQQGATCFGEPATVTSSGSFNGTSGDDVIVGSDGPDVIDGLSGDDRICGLDGNDILIGGQGDDRVDGGAGDDELTGDVSAGGSQLPTPDPGVSGDALGGGDDTLFGGDGDDIITGDSFAPNGNASGASAWAETTSCSAITRTSRQQSRLPAGRTASMAAPATTRYSPGQRPTPWTAAPIRTSVMVKREPTASPAAKRSAVPHRQRSSTPNSEAQIPPVASTCVRSQPCTQAPAR